VQDRKRVMRLPNNINSKNIDSIVDGIINYNIDGIGVRMVKFSGFIGEPLLLKETSLKAIQRLAGAGIQVGLFTNGVFMDSSTWKTLSNVEYVHISLDAGLLPITC
jgi:sulfatase maturation enzyme AslB (radical SAM superfamily)